MSFPYEKLPRLCDRRLAKLARLRIAHLRAHTRWEYVGDNNFIRHWEETLTRADWDAAINPNSMNAMRDQLLAIIAEQQRRELAPLAHERARLVLALHRAHGTRLIQAVDEFVTAHRPVVPRSASFANLVSHIPRNILGVSDT